MLMRITRWSLAAAVLGILSILVALDWDGGCEGMDLTDDEFSFLARIDRNGYALPVANLDFDDPGRWTLKITDLVSNDVVQTTDATSIKLLQSVKFACPGTDVATPHHTLSIFRDDKRVYVTGIVFEKSRVAFQNSEFGYSHPKGPGAQQFENFMRAAFPGYKPIDYFSSNAN